MMANQATAPQEKFDPELIKGLPKNVKKEELLIEWKAPARPYKKRNREYYTTIASIVFLLVVILLLLKEFLLIGVIIAFGFLSYVLATIPPENTLHQITSKGIRTENKLFEWEALLSFWLEKKWNQEILIIRTQQAFPGQIMAVIEPQKRTKILKEVGKKIPLEQPVSSTVDKASRWLQDKIPLENS